MPANEQLRYKAYTEKKEDVVVVNVKYYEGGVPVIYTETRVDVVNALF